MSPLTQEEAVRTALARMAAGAPAPARTDLDAAAAAWAAAAPSRRGPLRGLRIARPMLTIPALVAAVVLLVAALATGVVQAREPVPAQPIQGPVGLPAQWWTPPAWTPPVTERPIERAAAVLAVPDMYSRDGASRPGAVLVSADGREYRRLPWRSGPEDTGTSAPAEGLAVLAPDGRRVAWVELRTTGTPGVTRAFVHVLELSTGRDTVSALALGGEGDWVQSMVWSADGGELLLAGGWVRAVGQGDTESGALGLYRVRPGRAPVRLCDCGTGAVAALPDGRWAAVGFDNAAGVAGVLPLPADVRPEDDDGPALADTALGFGAIGGSWIAALPDGSGWVGLVAGSGGTPWRIGVQHRDGRRTLWPLPEENAMAPQILMATQESALVGLSEPSPDSFGDEGARDRLLRVDLATGEATQIGEGRGVAELRSLAADLAGATVPGERPSWPWYQPERLIALVTGIQWFFVFAAVLAAATGLLLSRRRRN